jgi:DNA polymerase III sliding clamp (beta) subunit (PCNA family)
MRLPQLPTEDYPPDPDRPAPAFELSADDLAAIARDLVPAASTDDTLSPQPQLRGLGSTLTSCVNVR